MSDDSADMFAMDTTDSSASGNSASSHDDGDFADPSDFFRPRDGDGNVKPVRASAGALGDVLIKPMSYGDAETFFGDFGDAAMIGPDTVADVLNEHLLKPDLDEYVRENVPGHDRLDGAAVAGEMWPLIPQQALLAIMRESGLEADVTMQADGSAAMEFTEGN